MLKKSISILLALVMLVSSAIGVSLVNVSAATDTEPLPTEQRDITKDELEIQTEVYIRLYTYGINPNEAFWDAVKYANKIVAKEDPAQEELNNAYYSLKTAFENLEGNNRPDVEDLENLARFECTMTPGDMYSDESAKAFSEAYAFVWEVIEKENSTREERYTAYFNLYTAHRKLETIGWYSAPYLLGDCDGDNNITVKDATKIQMILAKFTYIPDYLYTMIDVDRNFSIDIKDATKIQLYCAGYTEEENCGFTGEDDWCHYYPEFYTI